MDPQTETLPTSNETENGHSPQPYQSLVGHYWRTGHPSELLQRTGFSPRNARFFCELEGINFRQLLKDHSLLPDDKDEDDGATSFEEDAADITGALDEERTRYFKVSNFVFDWKLRMPPAFKLVWLCLQRYANNRRIPRLVTKISHAQMAAECTMGRRVVSQAIRFLGVIGAITVYTHAARQRDGTWWTGTYCVPIVSSLGRTKLMKAIDKVRREQPHLLRLRPDQHGEFARERVE